MNGACVLPQANGGKIMPSLGASQVGFGVAIADFDRSFNEVGAERPSKCYGDVCVAKLGWFRARESGIYPKHS